MAGDWATIVQQAAGAAGTPVMVIRADSSGHIDPTQLEQLLRQTAEPGGQIDLSQPVQPQQMRDVGKVREEMARWRNDLIRSLGINEEWNEDIAGEVYTDKPGWEGYGAVVLLAAYDEQPSLAPGTKVRRLFGSSTVPDVDPGHFQEAQAFKVAYESPVRYPTLLRGAEWCVPLTGGPPLFAAPLPGGRQVTMGHVDRLFDELNLLNQRTLRLGPSDLEAARQAGPADPEATFRFGLAVLMAVTEFAAMHRVAWIMDY